MQQPTATVENVFAASLKNGYHQLINSISVEITNNSVVNLTSFSNIAINYKLLTSCSREDELNFLPSINFVKDTAESLTYRKDASSAGYGEINNIVAQSLFSPTSGWRKSSFTQNAGRLQRMVNTSFDPSTSLNAAAVNYTSQTATSLAVKNYATQNSTDVVYYILAEIPLKILHDIFKKLPLLTGCYMRLICNTNCNCSATLVTNAAGTSFVSHTSSTQNGVLPFMISPVSVTGTGGTGLVVSAAATTITATMNILSLYTIGSCVCRTV